MKNDEIEGRANEFLVTCRLIEKYEDERLGWDSIPYNLKEMLADYEYYLITKTLENSPTVYAAADKLEIPGIKLRNRMSRIGVKMREKRWKKERPR